MGHAGYVANKLTDLPGEQLATVFGMIQTEGVKEVNRMSERHGREIETLEAKYEDLQLKFDTLNTEQLLYGVRALATAVALKDHHVKVARALDDLEEAGDITRAHKMQIRGAMQNMHYP